jgi:transcriptional regulator with XRE-family HTH domain
MKNQCEPHADKDRTTDFGKWLTEQREAAGLKQQRLAFLLGSRLGRDFHSGRISEWEQGQKLPPPEVVGALKAIQDPTGPEPPEPEWTTLAEVEVDLQLPR